MTSSLLYDFTIVSISGNSDQSDSSNLTFKNFPGGACPRTPLGGCASGARVRLRRTFRNSFDKGAVLHSDPGARNSLRDPGYKHIDSLKNYHLLAQGKSLPC